MLPVAVIMFAESLMPIAKIEAALQRVPIKVDNPYMALLYAYALTFVPMGVRLMISLATHNNVEPRKSVEQVSVFSRARASPTAHVAQLTRRRVHSSAQRTNLRRACTSREVELSTRFSRSCYTSRLPLLGVGRNNARRRIEAVGC